MEFTPVRGRVVEKMFDAAMKEKMNQLARKYDPSLVFELWTRIAKNGCIKPYFCKWRWKPDMTISEAIDCLDDYWSGLENLLQMRLEMRQEIPGGKLKNKETGPPRKFQIV